MAVSESQERQQRFAALLSEETHQVAWRYCCLLAASQADAEDLLHEALFQALRRLDQMRDPAAFRAWLLAIVRRRFLNAQRSRQRDAAGREQLARVEAAPGSGPEAEAAAAALAALPQEQRSLLTLFYLEGFSMRELAQALGIRPLAVQGRLARAREALRRAVSRQQPPPDTQRRAGHA